MTIKQYSILIILITVCALVVKGRYTVANDEGRGIWLVDNWFGQHQFCYQGTSSCRIVN